MLRRRFLTRIGLLMGAFVLGAMGALWALQDVLGDVEHANADAGTLLDNVQAIGVCVSDIELAEAGISSGGSVVAREAMIRQAMDRLRVHASTRRPSGPAAAAFERVGADLEAFLSATPVPADAGRVRQNARLHAGLADLGTSLRTHVAGEQLAVGRKFRVIVLALALGALVMVNVAAFVLIRTANLVLKPVGALMEGTRELAAEKFDHRVSVEQRDEFAELARAYNQMAHELQSGEARKAEAMRQLAVTLNHELNNALAIIELQLGLLDRQSSGNPAQAKHLREIRAGLARMAATVASLKQIRRVVLTDYGPGQKMIDLVRSVAEGADAPGEASAPASS